SDQRDHVVGEHQQDGQHESAGLAAFFRRQSQRDSNQRKYKTRSRQRETPMKFDQIPARGDGIAVPRFIEQCSRIEKCGGQRLVGLVGGRQVERNVGLIEGGNLVVIHVVGVGFVCRAVD